MSFVPFGIAPATGRQTKRPKVQPLAEFAEPDDHASEVDVLTEAEKRAEADKLQVCALLASQDVAKKNSNNTRGYLIMYETTAGRRFGESRGRGIFSCHKAMG